MSLSFFIEPLDVLYLRANKLFGEPGSYGESLVPPWPSVAAGAIRSALLVRRGYNLSDFAEGRVTDDAELGSPAKPGTFALAEFQLARRLQNGTVERLFPMPADLSVVRTKVNGIKIRRINPEAPAGELQSSSSTMHLAVLPETTRGKPETGYWLPEPQWESYLRGESVDSGQLAYSRELWAIDERVGVGLDPATHRAADGQIFTVQAIAMHKMGTGASGPEAGDVGFVAAVTGVNQEQMPDEWMLRFGGDGRGARATRTEPPRAQPDYEAIAGGARARIILTSPGIFSAGWKPNGCSGDGEPPQFHLGGVRGRLVCAAVPRAEVISGFDLAAWRPKPAQRAAPAGSVYWLDELDASADALRKLAERGLWSDPVENEIRRVEGFNRFSFAAW